MAGLQRLKERYIIAAFSNGNVALLVNMAKWGGLPWDFMFSAELFRHYKPDPQTYLGAAELLSLAPAEVMMVAAHNDDLIAADGLGLATAFVPRPGDLGPNHQANQEPGPAVQLRGRRLRRPGQPARRIGNGWPVSRGTPATRSPNPVFPPQEATVVQPPDRVVLAPGRGRGWASGPGRPPRSVMAVGPR